jgi:hypothetical protein
MPWVIVSEDGPNSAAIRADRAVMDAHWAYELSIRHKILCAGSLRSDDGVTPIGSLLVLDVDTREDAMAVVNGDPATKAGLRGKVTVARWNKAIFGGVVSE